MKKDIFQKVYYSLITESITLSDEKSKLVYNKTTGKYDSTGDVKIVKEDLIDGHFPFEFGQIKGNFDCSGLEDLVTLQGGPQQVDKDFICNNNYNLKSLKGAPEVVKGNFNISYCTGILNLEGATQNLGKDFICDYCSNLVSLKGGPQKAKGNYSCVNCLSLQDLEGAPYEVEKNFDCTNCTGLQSIHGGPRTVGKDCICTGCDNLVDLQERPVTGGNFRM